jgi:hypothetical protein
MSFVAKVSILCVLSAPLAAASAQELTISPVTRVVELLQGLAKQVEKEGKVEEGLYEDFVCWGKSIIQQKTASNAAARSRIAELQALLADLDAGRVELTSERTDLEKEISELMDDAESATELRNKENDDFLEAEDEMRKAINALDSAIETLHEATKDHNSTNNTAMFLAVRARVKSAEEDGGMASLMKRQATFRKATELGERFLEKADATFLRRVLFGEVPKPDFKKLNRKATFKMAYGARSFKIQQILRKMRDTFAGNLKDAQKKEDDATAEYKKVSASKKSQLEAAQAALGKMDSENGAQGMSKQETSDELSALKKQIADDEGFIAQTEEALDKQAAGWKQRSQVRTAELAAISKAIYILHNDDSRDLFKKSFASQENPGFLQVLQTSHKAAMSKEEKAAVALHDSAMRAGNKRLLLLASDIAKRPSVKGKFDPVVEAIDKMIDTLQEEEDKDLEQKQTCEEDRAKNTRSAITLSRGIDEMTEVIEKLHTDIETDNGTIKEILIEYDQTAEALDKAEHMRSETHRAWLQTNDDDTEAAKTVKSAIRVLSRFYEDQMALVQKGKQPVTDMAGGEAPPPPPPTWDAEASYAGKQGEGKGIIAIMDMVYEDIIKDLNDAKADEESSKKEFEEFEDVSKAHMAKLLADESRTSAEAGRAMEDKVFEEEQRTADKKTLNEVLSTIEGIDPNCEYYEVNYSMRMKNRQIEIDGLNKAKAILLGGVFTEGPDPDREMKPGDAAAAFLQSNKRFKASRS